MSSMSESNFGSLRWLFDSDEAVPITGLDGFVEIRFGSIRSRRADVGQQRLRYRSTTGRGLAVSGVMTGRNVNYIAVESIRDSIGSNGAVWAHEGEHRVGTERNWSSGEARYSVIGPIPEVEVRVQIRSASPLDRPLNAAHSFQVD